MYHGLLIFCYSLHVAIESKLARRFAHSGKPSRMEILEPLLPTAEMIDHVAVELVPG
jgi:hypothetical protein